MVMDEALVRASQQGDRTAFEQLVRGSARLVYARLYLLTGDAHQAEDLTQETYLAAWRAIAQVQDAARFRAWLLTIAQTTLTDSVRRRSRVKRSATMANSEVVADVAGTGNDPAEHAQQSDECRRAMAAMNDLPEEYRQVLMLRYLGGADYAMISRQLAITNGSLRGLLHRGLAMLRERLMKK